MRRDLGDKIGLRESAPLVRVKLHLLVMLEQIVQRVPIGEIAVLWRNRR